MSKDLSRYEKYLEPTPNLPQSQLQAVSPIDIFLQEDSGHMSSSDIDAKIDENDENEVAALPESQDTLGEGSTERKLFYTDDGYAYYYGKVNF
jgi:hypothetical protein